LPDGKTNFECHCIAPIMGSPCGYLFRESMLCRDEKSAEEFEAGACADEFMAFVECVVRTGCFECVQSLL
uniref:CHCH domain-containing protein n=1 Tax=Dracunculus medinensis TaxID=318479 RepID=A0A0N4UC83_DRAME